MFNLDDDDILNRDDDELELEPTMEIPELMPSSNEPRFNVDDANVGFLGGLGEQAIELDLEPEPEPVVIDNTVSIKEHDISGTLTANLIDDYSILPETEIKYPYMVFEAKGSYNTVATLCSGILKKGDTQLYFRPDKDDPTTLLPILTISKIPQNIRNLLRLSMKGSVRFRLDESSPERVVTPEQFIRYIDLQLPETDESYWNSLIEEEINETPKTPTFDIADIYG